MRIPLRLNRASILRAAVALAILLVIVVLTGLLAGPRLLKSKLEKGLSGTFHRQTTIRTVRFDPLLLELEMDGVRVSERDGSPLFTADRVALVFAPESLSRGTPVLSRALCLRPHLRLVRDSEGRWNIADIVRSWSEGSGPPPPFVLNAATVEGGRVDLLDRPSGRTFSLEEASLWIPSLSSLPEDRGRDATVHLGATGFGAPFRASGRMAPWAENPRGTLEATFAPARLEALPAVSSLTLPAEFAGGSVGGRFRAEVSKGDRSGLEARFTTDLVLSPAERGDGVPRTPAASLRGEGSWQQVSGLLEGRAEIECPDLDLPRLAGASDLHLPLKLVSGKVAGQLLATGSWSRKEAAHLLLSGELQLADLRVSEPGAPPFLLVPRARVRLAECEPLTGRYTLDGAVLERPRYRADGDWKGQFERLARALRAGGGPPAEIILLDLGVRGGELTFSSPPREGDFLTDLHGVELRAGPFGASATPTAFDLAARTTYGARLSVTGTVPPRAGPLRGEFRVEGFPLVRAASLLPPGITVTPLDGFAEISGRYGVDPASSETGLTLSGARLRIRSLATATPSGAEFLAVPELDVDGIEVDLDGRRARAARVLCRGGRLALQRDAEGAWDFRPGPAAPGGAGAGPWSLAADALDVEDAKVRFADWSLEEPAAITTERFDLWASDLSNARCAEAELGFTTVLGDGGRVVGGGTACIEPARGAVDMALRDIPLALLQPYIAERMNVEVQEGTLSSSGHLTADGPGDGPPDRARYDGDLLLARFRIVDRERWEDLLVWDTLHLGGVTLSSVPPRVQVREAALSDFYARAVIRPDATLNIFHLWKPAPPAPPGEVRTGAPATASFEQMVVQNGTVDFSDQFIRPSYSATVRELTGRLSGFDSSGGAAGDIEMRGRLGGGAPLEVVGMANPFKKDLFADIRASCRGVDLLPFSAYAGKYTGYAIAGGKLDLEVTYRMENRRLEAQSRIFLDQFTLGEKVQSEGAPGLPLKLAVSLLKNQRGEIRIEMPISGSMDALQLDFKPLVKKMVKSAVAKALASPFVFLGRLFRRGPELSFVSFGAGRSEIGADGAGVVAAAASKLAARPGARVSVAGLFEPQADEEALKRVLLDRRVRAQKATALRRQGLPEAAATAPVAPGEYEVYLKAFFDGQDIPKPRGEDGRPKALPADEMEKLLLAYTEVDLGDLRRLALDRAEAVRAALLAAGARDNQVYLVDWDSLPPAAAEGVRTRAAMALE